MKKADFFASLSAIFIGIIAIIIAFYFDGNAWTMAALFFIYFFGANIIFMSALGDELASKLSTGEILPVYGRRYWLQLITGAAASIILGGVFLRLFEATVFSGIHFGLGVMAILTAFVSPQFKSGSPILLKFPENDVFD